MCLFFFSPAKLTCGLKHFHSSDTNLYCVYFSDKLQYRARALCRVHTSAMPLHINLFCPHILLLIIMPSYTNSYYTYTRTPTHPSPTHPISHTHIILIRAMAEVGAVYNALKIKLNWDILMSIIHSKFCKKSIHNFWSYRNYGQTYRRIDTRELKHNLHQLCWQKITTSWAEVIKISSTSRCRGNHVSIFMGCALLMSRNYCAHTLLI